MIKTDVLIVGAGLTGATIAEHYARELNLNVTVIDKRDHIGGNAYDYIDKRTKLRISQYGAHIFHTNDKKVWDYVNRFGEMKRWEHKVVSKVGDIYVPIPVNPMTVNFLCGTTIMDEADMKEWLKSVQIKYDNPANGEEMAKSRVGEKLYDILFKSYTQKQWGKDPSELDKSVLARIPVRTTFDDKYFEDAYQGLPADGYTAIIQNMLNHKRINVLLNTSWDDACGHIEYQTLVFTGPIDRYFTSSGLPKLEYRSIDFSLEVSRESKYTQPNSVVNHPGLDVPFTRTVEYKHFLNQESEYTIVAKETTTSEGEPYYPVPNATNEEIYSRYQALAINERKKNVHFIGRLANYKYVDMDKAISNSMVYFGNYLKPRFSNLRFVIARYTEDTSWSDGYNRIIYNKGSSLDGSVELPNRGRESHTYLHHIIDNYNRLDDYTVFAQGNPFVHSPNFIKDLIKFSSSPVDFKYLSHVITPCNLKGCIYHVELPLSDVYFRVFGERTEKDFLFGWGAQFVVSKKAIRQHPLYFYQKMLAMVMYSKDPYEGYCFERFWGLVFGM